MNSSQDKNANKISDELEIDCIDFGSVSEETRGGFWGISFDGGWGTRFP